MAKTNRDRLISDPDWIGLVSQEWVNRPWKTANRKMKISKDCQPFIYGPIGGYGCACCFPAPRSNKRKGLFRSAKRKAERSWRKELD